VRRSRQQELEVAGVLGSIRVAPPADVRLPASVSPEWPVSSQLNDISRQPAAGG
jgi:hypothetical protein